MKIYVCNAVCAQELGMNSISYEWHGNMTRDRNIYFDNETKYLCVGTAQLVLQLAE
jgi:hypothetical protein